jgi:DNA repair exonuclease SbcCD ATPase subunit
MSTLSNSQPSPLTEAKPGSDPRREPRAIDQVFLTPRVLDARAFTEYAESLKSLIRDLDERSVRLSGASTDTDRLARVLREASGQLRQRAEAGTVLANRLDTQLEAAKSAVATLQNAMPDEGTLQRLVDRIAEKRQAAFEQAIEARLASAQARFEAAEKRAADAESRAAAAEQRLATIAKTLAAVNTQAESAAKTARDAVADAEQAAERSAGDALEALEQLRVLADDIRDKAEADAASIEQRLGPVRDLVARAGELVGTTDAPGSLPRAIDTARSLADRLVGLTASSERTITNAARAHATIVDTVNAAAESLESLRVRRDSLAETIEQDIESLAEEISPIERAAAALSRTLDDLASRTHALHEQIAGAGATLQRAESGEHAPSSLGEAQIEAMQRAAQSITEEALRQVEEAAEWLATLAAQASPPEPLRTPKQG